MTTTITDPLREIVLPRLERIRPNSGGFMARCPNHDDGTASLSISRGKDQPVVLFCHAGCDPDDILAKLDLAWSDLSKPRDRAEHDDRADVWMPCGWNPETKRHDDNHRKVAEYLYRDPRGQVVFGVARCALKGNGCQGFRQWRPDPTKRSGRTWSVTLPDGSKVGDGIPYLLPELREAIKAGRTILIVEGEKDVNRLANRGYPATCNAGGAGKWTDDHAYWLRGADIIIVADRDDAGWKHASHVVNTLLPVARSIEVVRAAGDPHINDLSDHLDAGYKLHQLVRVDEPLPAPHPCADGSTGCPCQSAGGR